MRHRGRKMLTAFVAVLALGVVASASASAALPEFVPGTGAKFPIAAEGSLPTANSNFTNKSGAQWFACEGAKFKGEITGAKAASLSVELERCSKEPTHECNTVGAAEGHIVVSGVAGLDYINKATKQVSLVLKVTKSEVKCGAVPIWITGSLVVPVTPVNSSTSTLDLKIKGSKGEEEYRKYENEKGESKTAVFGIGLIEEEGEAADFNVEQNEIKLATSKPLTIDA